MSLINEALRDIERRTSKEGNRTSIQTQLNAMDARGPDDISRRSRWYIPFWVIAGGVLFLGASQMYQRIDARESIQATIAEAAQDKQTYSNSRVEDLPKEIDASEPSSISPKADQVSITAMAQIENTKTTLPQISSQKNSSQNNEVKSVDEIDVPSTPDLTLIDSAREAIRLNRLTLPAEQSAAFYLDEAMATEELQDYARPLLKEARGKYRASIDRALLEQDLEKLNGLVARAALLNFSQEEISIWREQHDNLSSKFDNEIAITEKIPEIQPSDTRSDELNTSKTNSSETKLTIKASAETHDVSIVANAKTLIEKQREGEALSLLANYCSQNADAVHSPIFLFERYLNQHNTGAARELISRYEMNPELGNLLKAKLANYVGQSDRAVSLLEASTPSDSIITYHHYLLAGLYQQDKSYDKAIPLYELLLKRDANNTQYLLGYAVSNDATSRFRPAYRAYQIIQAVGHPNPEVMKFVKQRSDALANELANDKVAEATAW